MENVVCTPELVGMILGHMSRPENAVTALVSKLWLEHSRDHIWFNVQKPKELLALLVPLRKNPELDFTRVPLQEDWQRFEPFARRVNKIEFGKVLSVSPSMASTLLRSYSRPDPIFPNLRCISWSLLAPEASNDSVHILFMHSGVRSLNLQSISKDRVNWKPYTLRSTFLDIASIAPNISVLELRPFSLKSEGISSDVIDLVKGLPSLTKLKLFPELLTTSLLRELSKLEHLEEILPMSDDPRWTVRDPHNAIGFVEPVALKLGAFRTLKTLHLSMPTQAAIRFLADEHFPSAQLIDLRIRLLDCMTNTEVRGLLTLIASSCKNLLNLVLVLYPPGFALQDQDPESLESLDADAIEPLCQATTLESLHIYHIVAADVSSAQLLRLIESLPNLNSLHFIPCPDCSHESTFGWQTLVTILQRFPRVCELGLYLDLFIGRGVDAHISPRVLWPDIPEDGLPSYTVKHLYVGTTDFPTDRPPVIANVFLALFGEQVALDWGTDVHSQWGVPPPQYSAYSKDNEDPYLWEKAAYFLYFGFTARSGLYHARLHGF